MGASRKEKLKKALHKRASKGWISGLAKGLIFTVGGLSLGTRKGKNN